MKMNRRKFIYGAAVTTAATLSARSWGQVEGSNSDIRVATIGFNGRGKDHIEGFRKTKGARLVALCDADSAVIAKQLDSLTEAGSLQTYTDLRKLLESKEIDVVSIATPNHWHTLAAIWAIQAGKDVYVEKPVSHNVWEGRQLVKAARKYEKIVQTGTQCRSNPGTQEAVQFLHDGKLGRIKVSRGLCYKRRPSIGKVDGPQQPPETVDYDLWCGPAPMEPLMRKKLHYDWHWVWSTGNGDLGNQGIRQMDIARWILAQSVLSPAVFSVGGRLGYVDDGQTANTQIVYHDYATAPLIFEVRGLPTNAAEQSTMDKLKGASVGNIVECEEGYVVFPGYDNAIAYDKNDVEIRRFKGSGNHFENFLNAVRSRKHGDLNADILQGHLSSALCHTGNVSYRLGHKRSVDEIKDQIKSERSAEETFGRMLEHLAANDINLHETPLTMGTLLRMDPVSERFIGNDAANDMLTRNYRKPYVVPEIV